jgi:hypothetical protein
MIKEFEGLNKDLLLKKAKELKQTDAEGWAIGELVEQSVKLFNIPNVGKRYQLWNTTERIMIYATDSHDEVLKRFSLVLPNKRLRFLIVDMVEELRGRISIDDSIKILDSFMDEEMTFDSEEEKVNFKLDIVNKYKQKAKPYIG